MKDHIIMGDRTGNSKARDFDDDNDDELDNNADELDVFDEDEIDENAEIDTILD